MMCLHGSPCRRDSVPADPSDALFNARVLPALSAMSSRCSKLSSQCFSSRTHSPPPDRRQKQVVNRPPHPPVEGETRKLGRRPPDKSQGEPAPTREIGESQPGRHLQRAHSCLPEGHSVQKPNPPQRSRVMVAVASRGCRQVPWATPDAFGVLRPPGIVHHILRDPDQPSTRIPHLFHHGRLPACHHEHSHSRFLDDVLRSIAVVVQAPQRNCKHQLPPATDPPHHLRLRTFPTPRPRTPAVLARPPSACRPQGVPLFSCQHHHPSRIASPSHLAISVLPSSGTPQTLRLRVARIMAWLPESPCDAG